MTKPRKITVEEAKTFFKYDRNSGELFQFDGTRFEKTGTVCGGYNRVSYKGRGYQATYIIWLIVHGYAPKGIIEHADLDKLNDRLVNLREATETQNRANTRKPRSNTSGYKGVHWNKNTNKWVARIGYRHETINLGAFTDIKEVKKAYDARAKYLFGKFARS